MTRNLQLRLFLFTTLFAITINAFSQYDSRGADFDKVDANNFYDEGNYYDALPLYESLIAASPDKLDYQLKAGICYIHLSKSPEKAIILIQTVLEGKATTQNALFYLAKAYAINYKFDLAIETYEKAQSSMATSSDKKRRIPLLIQQCRNGLDLMEDSLAVEIVNMGGLINSSANEYSPSITSDETMLVFTYRGVKSEGDRQNKYNKPAENGNYYEDIYKSQFVKGSWTQSMPISDSINTKGNEAAISISGDGEKLYLFKDTKSNSGDIYVSEKTDDSWSEPKRLAINSKYWEGHAAVNSNGDFMLFSSNRVGGYGGQDLYSATLLENGKWGNIKNLGSTINTKYNEDAPFFQPDDSTFNFSSQGHTSMGGYDIFEAKMNADKTYSAPRNIGYPINTTSNDIFYSTSGKGNVYYSSARKGGFGQNDIYQIIDKGMTIKGKVLTKNEPIKPIRSLIVSITNKARTFNLSDTTDNEGRYQFSNMPSDDYSLSFLEEEEDVEAIDSVYVFEGQVTRMGKAQKGVKINDNATDESGKYHVEIAKERNMVDDMSTEEIEDKYGDQTAEELIFVVQVAALQNPNYFDGKDIKTYGEVENVVLEDGLTRFTIGKFKTLNEANDLLEKVKTNGEREDAFVLLFINGKRTYLQDLVDDGTFK